MEDETMVENIDEAEQEEFPEDIVEDEDSSEEEVEQFLEDEVPDEEEPEPEPEAPPATEPGWIKQRVNKAVQKAIAEKEAEMLARFEQQMAPIREKMMEDEAQELLRNRKVSDIETARELVRLRHGQNAGAEPQEQVEPSAEPPRNEKGQYTSAETVRTEARIEMLRHQADRIRQAGGPDVIAEFQNNEDVKMAIIKGEMDFYDVAEQLTHTRKKPPAPMRSPNGANGVTPRSIESMSDSQFKKMDEMLDKGVRFTFKR